MIQFSNQELTNERLVLDSATELYYLGHNLTLRNCTLIIRVPARALVIARTRLIDCTIEAKRQLNTFLWDAAFLKGCRFKGRFSGNDFGSWPDTRPEGGIEDCDFAEAHLDGCRFLGCDIRTVRFPRWPCFTIFDPARRAHELSAVAWPGDIGPVVIAGFAEYPPGSAAVTYSATTLARESGTTLEAIKAVLEKLDGVYF